MTALLFALAGTPDLVPVPVSLTPRSGVFQWSKATRISGPKQFVEIVGVALGAAKAPVEGTKNEVVLVQAEGHGPEGYGLEVRDERIEIVASAPAGMFYAVQTLKQLMPPQSYAGGTNSSDWQIPAVSITDRPRFGYRGFMLDVARHFMPTSDVKRIIDVMAMHKLNTLHWHLTDDQGWRIEIKQYPKLTEIGSRRKETMLGHYSDQKWDGKPHGGFYTQDQIRDVVKYAQDRFIMIVPEIEMPGHASAAIASYPELGNTGEPIEVGTRWGVIEDIFNPEDSTIRFLQNVLTEVIALFPGKFIHIGGDEAPKEQWKKSPAAQEKIKSLGLKDEHELQSWFVKQMDQFLASKGRRLIGWDEILEGGLAPGATVMSWRGEAGGITAARAGHDVVMTPTDFMYLDYLQSKAKTEPLSIGGFLPLEKVYSYDPATPELTEEQSRHILGVQGNLWTEYIADRRKVEYMAFPRLSAVAEIGWSPQSNRTFPEFRKRLESHLKRLDAMGVNYRPLDPLTD